MSTFFISDTHFDHGNIIRYCDRPFRTVQEMNDTLIENWNRVVGRQDTVFHLGDLAFGQEPLKWTKRLNGNIIFINGSHEKFGMPFFILGADGTALLLIHNPDFAPKDWPGWIVHGHKHNNNLLGYPFINQDERRVNVSAELINYTPISLGVIEKIIPAKGKEINKC